MSHFHNKTHFYQFHATTDHHHYNQLLTIAHSTNQVFPHTHDDNYILNGMHSYTI